MKSSREQFEEWFNKRSNWKITPSMRKKDGYVGNPSAQSKWEVWKASRAAIEIELPAVIWDMSEDGSQHYDRDDVIDAIQSVDIKVKA